MVSTSIKMRSQMAFQSDALAIVKIIIFCNNQSSHIMDKLSPCALTRCLRKVFSIEEISRKIPMKI